MNREHREPPALDADEAAALQAIGWRPSGDESACPDSALLLPAEEGVLDDAATGARVMAHVESCSTCRQLAADMASVLAEDPTADERARISAGILAARSPARRTARWWLATSGLLATAAIAVAMFVPWRTLRSVEPPALPGTSGVTGAPSNAAAPSVFVGSRPLIARPEPELTLRGESRSVPVLEQIGQALDAADAGDVPGAIETLNGIVQRHPSSADAHLALGATLLRADRAAQSLPILERATSLMGDSATDEFNWYLATALARSSDLTRATAILEPLCRQNTMRGAMACAGLLEIRRNSPR